MEQRMKPTVAIYGIQDRKNTSSPVYVHDHSLIVMENGRVTTCLQLERATRFKHDNRMHLYLEELWDSEKLSLSGDFDVVFVDSFVGRAFISQSGRIRFEAPIANTLHTDREKGYCWWDGKEIDGYVLNQELAHIYSCIPFYGMFYDNSLLIHFDGGASQSNFSAWCYRDGVVKLLEYNWDMSYLSKYFNDNALTFGILGANRTEHLSVPGKLMGYAAYGTYRPEILEWLRSNGYFKELWQDKTLFWESARRKFHWLYSSFDTHDSFLQDIAATFQYDFQNQLLLKIESLQLRTKCDYLYLTGGCALNIQANMEIVKSGLFKDVFIPPCCNDSGLALGAAVFMELHKHNKIVFHSPYLNNFQIKEYEVNYTTETIQKVAELLLQNKVIGVCNGYGEIGPRALGNRSIIALANSVSLRDQVSIHHKQREWYRPVAPIMLEKNAKKITGLDKISSLAKYMLIDFKVLPKFMEELSGVVHINGTSRIQILSQKSENPFMYDLLNYLDHQYGIHCLINTSLNSKGEPIVHTKEDAINSSKKMKLDALVVNGILSFFDGENYVER